METKLYDLMGQLGGMNVPLNPPSGKSQNLRLKSRGGEKAADFPAALVAEQPVNTNAN